jgi:hypothetical protein
MPAAVKHNSTEEKNECVALTRQRDNVTVDCICPKCGTHHKMKLRWTGRGKPKKFCQPCKTFVTSIEQVEFYGVPTDVNKGLEKAV